MKMTSMTKASLIPECEKLRDDCLNDLSTMKEDDPSIRAVKCNLALAEGWIKFLSDPDVPELDDPQFKSKMKKSSKKRVKKVA